MQPSVEVVASIVVGEAGMIRHYVEFTFPGTFFCETTVESIASRDAEIVLPPRAFAYRLFDREEVDADGETLKGQPKNFGPRHFRGAVLTLEDVKREYPQHGILIGNMECNGYARVCRCQPHGNFVPMEPEDVVIKESAAPKVESEVAW